MLGSCCAGTTEMAWCWWGSNLVPLAGSRRPTLPNTTVLSSARHARRSSSTSVTDVRASASATDGDNLTHTGDIVGIDAVALGATSSSVDVVDRACFLFSATQSQFVYERLTGNLYYDRDGSGATASVLFAKVGVGLALTSANFDIV